MHSFPERAAYKIGSYVKKRSVKAPIIGVVFDPPEKWGHVEHDTNGEEVYHQPEFVYGFFSRQKKFGSDAEKIKGKIEKEDIFRVGKPETDYVIGANSDKSEWYCMEIAKLLEKELIGIGCTVNVMDTHPKAILITKNNYKN